MLSLGGVQLDKGLYSLHEYLSQPPFVTQDLVESFFVRGVLLHDELFERILQELKNADSEVRFRPEVDVNGIAKLFVHKADLRLQVHEVVLPRLFVDRNQAATDEVLVLVGNQRQDPNDVPRGQDLVDLLLRQ